MKDRSEKSLKLFKKNCHPVKSWAALFVFVLVVVLWILDANDIDGALSIGFWDAAFTIGSKDQALHLILVKSEAQSFFSFSLSDIRHSYSFGYGFNILGIVLDILPYQYSERDFFIHPHGALVFPFWLVSGTSGGFYLIYSGWGKLLKRYLRFSEVSMGIMGFAMILFFVLNISSSDGTFRYFGFPFTYLILIIQNGHFLEHHLGSSPRWHPLHLGNNLFINLLLILSLGAVSEWVLRDLLMWETSQQPKKHERKNRVIHFGFVLLTALPLIMTLPMLYDFGFYNLSQRWITVLTLKFILIVHLVSSVAVWCGYKPLQYPAMITNAFLCVLVLLFGDSLELLMRPDLLKLYAGPLIYSIFTAAGFFGMYFWPHFMEERSYEESWETA